MTLLSDLSSANLNGNFLLVIDATIVLDSLYIVLANGPSSTEH